MGQGSQEVPRAAAVGADAPLGIGAYLARHRRLRGMSVEELAALTRIPPRSISRLEAGSFDAHPDGFARGFVRTVAEALGLPPDDTVALMLPEVRLVSGRRWRRGPVLALALLLGVALAAFVGAWRVLARTPPEAVAPGRDVDPAEVLRRRDAVRELAREVGVEPGPTAPPVAPGGD